MKDSFLSKRAREVPRVGSRLSGEKAGKYKSEGIDIISLSGAPLTPPGENVLEAASKACYENGKSPSKGLLELRKAIAVKIERENGFKANPEEEILVTTGAMQALYIIMTGLLNPGEEVLMASPAFFFNGIIELVGGKTVYGEMDEEEGFRLEPALLEEKITPQTKLLILNTPANPTGYVATRENLEAIAEIVIKNDLIVVSDESYEKLVYDGRKHHSLASLAEVKNRVITVQSFTKSYAMPGWRVGYLVATKDIVRPLQKVLEWMILAGNYVAQKAALAALTGPQDWVKAIPLRFQENRNELVDGLSDVKDISFVTPEGGPFLFLNISGLGMKAEEFSEYIMKNYGIRNTPGLVFNSDNHVRLPFGGRKENVKKAVERLKKAVQGLRVRE